MFEQGLEASRLRALPVLMVAVGQDLLKQRFDLGRRGWHPLLTEVRPARARVLLERPYLGCSGRRTTAVTQADFVL